MSSRNDNVDDLNAKFLDCFPGKKIVLTSADSVVTEGGADGNIQYPVEFLNTVNRSGMPLSKLELKIGAPVMILRNIDPSHGLCYGAHADLVSKSLKFGL